MLCTFVLSILFSTFSLFILFFTFVMFFSVPYNCFVYFCSLRLSYLFLFFTFVLFILFCSFVLFSSLLYVCSVLSCSVRLLFSPLFCSIRLWYLHKIQLIESRSKKSSKQSRNGKRKFLYFCSTFIFTQFKQDVIHLNFLHFLFKKQKHCRFSSIKL